MVENVDLSDVDILIYNTFGSVVKRIQNPGNTINVSELPNGNYFMNIQGRNLFVSRRFIKIN